VPGGGRVRGKLPHRVAAQDGVRPGIGERAGEHVLLDVLQDLRQLDLPVGDLDVGGVAPPRDEVS
jgi:hypothetical protein